MAIISVGQITISDFNDINISNTAPSSPATNQLWLDSSVVPNQLKRWDGSKWVIVNQQTGRNLFSLHHLNNLSPSSWIVTSYLYEFWLKPNTEYILSTNLPVGQNSIYFNGGGAADRMVDVSQNLIRVTDEEGYLLIAVPVGRPQVSQIFSGEYWVKLEEGNTATPWSPAPEDLENKVDNIVATVSQHTTDIDQNKQAINLRALSTEVEGKIYKQSTAPAHTNGRLWLDTSAAPNILKRSTGSAWVNVSPTKASEIGLTDTAITQKVQAAKNAQNEPLFALTSEVKQTVDTWTAKFSQVGGENLFRDSEDLSAGRWTLYQGAAFTSGYPTTVAVPEWSTEEAWRVRTTSAGTNATKAYVNLSQDLAKLRSRPFTLSVYAKNNRTDASVEVSTNRFGGETLGPGEMRRIIISGENDNGLFMQLQLSAQSAAHYLDVTIYHPKFETGWVASDWNDQLYTGITTINKDGVKVGRSGETIETTLGFDGVRINDGPSEIASFLGSGAVIMDLQAAKITGDVINILNESLTYDIGTGTGYFADFSEVLNDIGNRKYLPNGIKITINVRGVLNDNIEIQGFAGGGEVEVNFYNKVNAFIRTGGNTCQIKLTGRSSSGHVIRASGYVITSSSDAYLFCSNLNVDGKGNSSGIGILAQGASRVYVENCDIIGVNDALYASSGATLQSGNNRGNPVRFAFMASSGRIYARGNIPDGGSYGFVTEQGTTRTASTFSPPATTTAPETLTFNHTDIYTYSVAYGAKSSHYGKAAAQNRWTTSMTQMKGRISFGSGVYNFIAGRNSGTTPTVKLRLRRQNSTHGPSSSVAPTPEWSGAPSFGGATRGNWTPWATIPYSLFTSAGYTFSFYNGTTGNSYAIWDRAELQITRTITQ